MKLIKKILISTISLLIASATTVSVVLLVVYNKKNNTKQDNPLNDNNGSITNVSNKEIIATSSEQYSLSANFNSSISEKNLSYEWSVDSSNVVLEPNTINSRIVKFSVNTPGTYQFTTKIKNTLNNELLTTINQNIKVYAKPVISINSLSSDFYTTTQYKLSSLLSDDSIPNIKYEWSVLPNNGIILTNNNSKDVIFEASNQGQYTFKLNLKDQYNNILNSATKEINIINKPTQPTYQLEILSDDGFVFNEGETKSLYAQLTPFNANVNYEWSVSPSFGLTFINSKNEEYIEFVTDVANNYTFNLKVTDNNGKTIATASKQISVNSSTPTPPSYSATINNPYDSMSVNNSYELSVSVNPTGTYYYSWYGDPSLNIREKNHQVSIQPSSKGIYPISVDVFSDLNKQNKIVSATLSLTINEDIPTVDYKLSWNNFNTYHNLNDTYQLTANLTNEPNTVYYEWTSNNSALQLINKNSKTISYSTSTPGEYELTLNAYKDSSKSKLLASKTAFISFNNLHTPNEEEILVTNIKNGVGNPFSGGGGFISQEKFIDQFNNYGVLNTYALTTYMYMRSEFITRGFENVYYQLIKNDSYNDLSFRIFGIATQDIATWGDSIAISTLVEGISGFNVKVGDKVDLTIRFKRTDTVNQGTNNFNNGTCYFKNANVTLKRNPNWGSPINEILPFYTSGWSSFAQLKINNKIIKDTSSIANNRTVFVFAWKNSNQNYFVHKKSILF